MDAERTFNYMQWPIEKTSQVIWDALLDYGRIECKRTLMDLEKAPYVAYGTFLTNFIRPLGGGQRLALL